MDLGKLLISLGIDIVGMGSYAIPIVGELGDVFYAPFSALLIYYLYKNEAFAILGFLEEIGTGTDFVPTATLAWIYSELLK